MNIQSIQFNCESCDIYDPCEGNCRECLQKAMDEATKDGEQE